MYISDVCPWVTILVGVGNRGGCYFLATRRMAFRNYLHQLVTKIVLALTYEITAWNSRLELNEIS